MKNIKTRNNLGGRRYRNIYTPIEKPRLMRWGFLVLTLEVEKINFVGRIRLITTKETIDYFLLLRITQKVRKIIFKSVKKD